MITLTLPPDPPSITHAKVVAMKMEDNVEHWIKAWVAFGYLNEGDFVEYRHSATRTIIQPVELHFEDGCHPFDPSRSLRQCPSCNEWYATEVECPSCEVATEPYDAFSRLVGVTPGDGYSCCLGMTCAIHQLVVTDQVPDLITGELRFLIEGEFIG